MVSFDTFVLIRTQVNEGKSITYRNITISIVSGSSNPPKNTDGWDTYRSDGVVISDSVVTNTDDCVSFKPSEFPVSIEMHHLLKKPHHHSVADSTNILVANMFCSGSQYVNLTPFFIIPFRGYIFVAAFPSVLSVNTQENSTLYKIY